MCIQKGKRSKKEKVTIVVVFLNNLEYKTKGPIRWRSIPISADKNNSWANRIK
jgi:hypothetical protein